MTTAHAITEATAVLPDNSQEPSRKRRRSREPDWNTFFRNGLPKEIIVIDDTPEPEANIGRKITSVGVLEAPRQNAAKKRRKDDKQPGSSGYYVQNVRPQAQAHTTTHLTSPVRSTLPSSDRTNSALNTTAPTSLSANAQFDDVQAPLKRKRTRQQVANGAKRRDDNGFGDSIFTYKPLPYPPKKAPEVKVRVVHDVRLLLH